MGVWLSGLRGSLGYLVFIFLSGWGDFITSEPRHPHEIIDISFPRHKRISEKVVELYEKGHSIAETAAIVGVPASSLYDVMKEKNIPIRPAWKARRKNPPYGYAWLLGEIVMNPLEYKNVLLILELAKIRTRPHRIANYLNTQGIKPRRGKKWFARTVTDILRRIDQQSCYLTAEAARDAGTDCDGR